MAILNQVQKNVKLCYMETDSFIIHIKNEDFYKDIADDIKKNLIDQIMKWIDHCLQEKLRNWWIDEDELGGNIMTKSVAIRTLEHNLKWPYIPDHPYRILIE